MDLNYLKLLKTEDWEEKVKKIGIEYLRDNMKSKCIFLPEGCQYGNQDISNLRKHIKTCKFRKYEPEDANSYSCLTNPLFWKYMGTEDQTISACAVSILKIWKIPKENWKTINITNKLIIHLLDRNRLKGTFKRNIKDKTIMIYDGKIWLHKKNNESLWRAELLLFKTAKLYPFIEKVILTKLRWFEDEPILVHFMQDMDEVGYDSSHLLNNLENYDDL